MTRFFLSVCAAAVLGLTGTAMAEPFKATYGLYAGGVRMIDLKADFDLQPKNYTVRTDGRTIGIFEKILPWIGTFETKGTAGFKPVRHDYIVSWRGNQETSTFTYEPAGVLKNLTVTKDGETTENPIDLEIAKGTRDLLSTITMMFDQYERTGKCEGDILTFDNARSFIVRFADLGDGVMDNAKLSSYTGPAHACSVEIIPQAGKWPKKPRGWLRIQQQAKEGGKLPVLWMAKSDATHPAIPVRVDIHTKYGDVIAHLSSVN